VNVLFFIRTPLSSSSSSSALSCSASRSPVQRARSFGRGEDESVPAEAVALLFLKDLAPFQLGDWGSVGVGSVEAGLVEVGVGVVRVAVAGDGVGVVGIAVHVVRRDDGPAAR
jgi:hypothetical protein